MIPVLASFFLENNAYFRIEIRNTIKLSQQNSNQTKTEANDTPYGCT